MLEVMGYGKQKSMSYEVQQASDQDHARRNYGGTKMLEGSRIHDMTMELLSNGMLAC
jgi:hypothetical protein